MTASQESRRLELQSAVLAVRMKEAIIDEMDSKLDIVYFGTDSMIQPSIQPPIHQQRILAFQSL